MQPSNSISEIKAVPFFSQFTDAQIRAQVKKSLEGIQIMEGKAIATGKKVGGFTVSQLAENTGTLSKNFKFINNHAKIFYSIPSA
jgi:hypothetical protein